MRWSWVVGVLLAGCPERSNPRYCDDNSDCNVGTSCNLETHGCVVVDAAMSSEMDSDAPRIVTSVRELRDPTVPADTLVELSDVVITAIATDAPGQLWVQDHGGGFGSGVHIFGGVLSELSALAVGDVIAVTNAQKQLRQFDGTSSREVAVVQRSGGVLGLAKTGANIPPTITTVTVDALAALTPSELTAELDRWAGTLVAMQPTRVTAGPDASGLYSMGPLRLSSLTGELPDLVIGTCLMSVIGVVQYSSGYVVSARDVEVGSSCP
jgi:hypothetical protein